MMARSLARAEADFPVERIEIRPGRTLAVYQKHASNCRAVAILVHGSAATLLQWQHQIKTLEKSNLTVIAFDLLGCGRSAKPSDWYAYAIREHLEDVREVVRRFSIHGKPTVVFGHSMGCTLAIKAAHSAAEIAALVLICPVAALPGSVALFRLPLFLLEWMQPTLSKGFTQAAFHAETLVGHTPEHSALLALSAELQGANSMRMCKAYYRQLELATPEELALPDRVGVLVIAGEADLVAPKEEHASVLASTLLKGVPPSERVKVVERASHQCMQEQPSQVNGLIQAFLDERGL